MNQLCVDQLGPINAIAQLSTASSVERRILAVIPARSGSKRLPNKNIKMLGDKPLIAWTIEVAKNIAGLDVIVSTDSVEIALIAEEYGATVPWLRPRELATDTSTATDVCIHALDWYEKKRICSAVMLLQPTSPFRTRETIIKGILGLYNGSVIGVSKCSEIPYWAFTKSGDILSPLFPGGLQRRSQDLPDTYRVNGSFYLIRSNLLRKYRSIIGRRLVSLVTEYPENLDIDTEEDFNDAERELRSREKCGTERSEKG